MSRFLSGSTWDRSLFAGCRAPCLTALGWIQTPTVISFWAGHQLLGRKTSGPLWWRELGWAVPAPSSCQLPRWCPLLVRIPSLPVFPGMERAPFSVTFSPQSVFFLLIGCVFLFWRLCFTSCLCLVCESDSRDIISGRASSSAGVTLEGGLELARTALLRQLVEIFSLL